jgi:hypothetical protein
MGIRLQALGFGLCVGGGIFGGTKRAFGGENSGEGSQKLAVQCGGWSYFSAVPAFFSKIPATKATRAASNHWIRHD